MVCRACCSHILAMQSNDPNEISLVTLTGMWATWSSCPNSWCDLNRTLAWLSALGVFFVGLWLNKPLIYLCVFFSSHRYYFFPALYFTVLSCAERLLPPAQAAAYRNSLAEQPGRTVPPAELPHAREIPVCLAVQAGLPVLSLCSVPCGFLPLSPLLFPLWLLLSVCFSAVTWRAS